MVDDQPYQETPVDDELDLYTVDGNLHQFAVDKLQSDSGVTLGLQFDEKSDELAQFAYTQNTHPSQQAVFGSRMEDDQFLVTRTYGNRHPAIRLLPRHVTDEKNFLKNESTVSLEVPEKPASGYESFVNDMEEPLSFLLNHYDVDPDAAEENSDVYVTQEILHGDMDIEPMSIDQLTEFAADMEPSYDALASADDTADTVEEPADD
jgi:hypothetical protein